MSRIADVIKRKIGCSDADAERIGDSIESAVEKLIEGGGGLLVLDMNLIRLNANTGTGYHPGPFDDGKVNLN